MSKRPRTSWRPRAAGVTLVEALVGSLLLGTLLVTMLLARGQATVQTALSDRRILAAAVLDELLQDWWADATNLPRSGAGDVPDRPGWRWRTQRIDNRQAQALWAEVVAVEVFAPSASARTEPDCRVEILLPVEPPQSQDSRSRANTGTPGKAG